MNEKNKTCVETLNDIIASIKAGDINSSSLVIQVGDNKARVIISLKSKGLPIQHNVDGAPCKK
jgi:hypothetical protein